jgi:Kef-type K+ transport system membrane component KefB
MAFGLLLLKFIALTIALFLGVRWIMLPLLTRFDVVQEYTFVATLGWCLLGAEAAHLLGLSYEIGAFTAGISIASSPVALAIAEHLKPLREFFLILFFFAIGARLNLQIDPLLLTAAIIFGVLLVPLKAFIFRKAFAWSGEKEPASKELSVRLSQASEFSLLVVIAATNGGWLQYEQGMMIQIATLITFIFSTYWTVLRYPTPISASRDLLQD